MPKMIECEDCYGAGLVPCEEMCSDCGTRCVGEMLCSGCDGTGEQEDEDDDQLEPIRLVEYRETDGITGRLND